MTRDGFDGFETFYDRERERVLVAVTLTVGDRDLAADAVDEAFTRAAERWERVAPMANRAGWVYRVAVNWATSWRRSRRRRPVLPIEELDRQHHDRLPDVDVQRQLLALPLDQRRTVVLRYVLDLSVDDTARLLDVAPGTVRARTSRLTRSLAGRTTAASAPEEQP